MKCQKDAFDHAGRLAVARRHARHALDPPVLRFEPLAWLKLVYLCHAGQTEVGCFGISSSSDLLYVDQVVMPLQSTSAVTVEFSDGAVADHFDRFADQGVAPARCGRIWLHTHPGESASPSRVDEATFDRVFGPCDWALMFILSRTGRTYARLRFSAGPGGQTTTPVAVDWRAWPRTLQEQGPDLAHLVRQWEHEYQANVVDVSHAAATANGFGEPWDLLDLHDGLALDEQLQELPDLPELRDLPGLPGLPGFAKEVSHDD